MKKSKILTLSILLILVSPQLLSLTAIADEMAVTASTEERRTESSEEESSDGSSVSKKENSSDELSQTEAKTSADSTATTSTETQNSSTSEPSSTESSSEASQNENSTQAKTSKTSTENNGTKVSKPSIKDKKRGAGLSSKISSKGSFLARSESRTQIQKAASLFRSYNTESSNLFDSSSPSLSPSVISVAYVEHWSGPDAYHHNLLSHRYGITAAQLDGFLASTNISYDKHRINGAKLLEWEKVSGLDVRAIIAIAMAESSLGTAGVATVSKANMFGYGAFDYNTSNAINFSDEEAVKKLTAETIIQNKNITFKIQDDKAKKYSMRQLNTVVEGGVYFTDTSGTGKRRAQIMQEIDSWIDRHGGTPAIPENLKHLNSTSIATVPTGYKLTAPINTATYIALSYPWGQCTWYVYNRARELGYLFDPYMGNGGDWRYKSGYELTHSPKVGYAISFAPGQAGADSSYGHVAIVEEVRKDGSILVSESNALGEGVISYRTFNAQQALELTYVIGKKI